MATPDGTRAGGKETTISRGVIARVTGMISGAAQGAFNGWFGPGTPMSPAAPPGQGEGRAFDYPYGLNMTYTPRGEQGENAIGFETLRRFADPAQGGLDLLRLAIEKRKNQMAAQQWAIRGRDKHSDGGRKARDLETALRRPDGVHTFRMWTRMLLEDHYVLDAPTVYYGAGTPTRPLLEVVDGATIKLVIDNGGRTPQAPLPAYQQILHGLPAHDYTTRELGYYMFNPRPNRIYGMSHVEQVVGILAIALNRQLSVLQYYTEGTVPDVFITVPESWPVETLKKAQEWFDSILSGQTGERRKARMIPGGAAPIFTKDQILKNEFDEWLARVICFGFGLSPETLVKQTNRATADTAKESAQEDGLEPEKLWFKDVMDDALDRMGAPELEWQWQDEEIADPKVKAEVISTYVGGKAIATVQQGREMAGLAPATPKELEEIAAANAPAPMLGPDDSGDGDPPVPPKKKKSTSSAEAATKLAKRGGRSLRPLKRKPRLVSRTRKAVRKLVLAVLDADRNALLGAIAAEKIAKLTETDVVQLLSSLPTAPWSAKIRAQLADALALMATDRSSAAMAQVQTLVDEANYETLFAQANEKAVVWAMERVGNLVTDVDATTREAINKLSAAAIENGWSNDELAAALEENFGFSDARADMIARTETAESETQGALIGYRESGVVDGKEWAADAEACDECQAMDGEIVTLDESFSDGSDGPPAHPNCECFVAPVVAVDEADA